MGGLCNVIFCIKHRLPHFQGSVFCGGWFDVLRYKGVSPHGLRGELDANLGDPESFCCVSTSVGVRQ